MRKKLRILKDKPDASPVTGHEDAFLDVRQHAPRHGDASGVGPQGSRDDIQDGGLSRAGRPDQRRDAGAALERNIEQKIFPLLTNVDAQNGQDVRHSNTAICFCTRRFSISDAKSAAIAIAIDTSVSLRACASPPGTCV